MYDPERYIPNDVYDESSNRRMIELLSLHKAEILHINVLEAQKTHQ